MFDRRGFLSAVSGIAATAALPIPKTYEEQAHQDAPALPDYAVSREGIYEDFARYASEGIVAVDPTTL